MKLIKIYVSSFGKIKDFEYELKDGVNTVKQENGWGKSTLAYFIKCIFYGIKDGKRSIEENERMRFKPWNSTEKFGGYVIFEWAGKRFKVERFFGNKQSEDTVRIFDAETGKEFNNNTGLGERIFKIDEEGFLSTVFFSQKELQVKSNSSLTAKFNQNFEMQETEAFDNAVKTLSDKHKKYKYSGNRGYIPEAKDQLFNLEQKIGRATVASDTYGQLTEIAEIERKEISELNTQIKNLTDQTAIAGKAEAVAIKKENYSKKLSERNIEKEKLSALNKVLNGVYPQDDQINCLSDCISEYNKCIDKQNFIKTNIDELTDKMQTSEQEKANEKPNKFLPFFIMSAILLAGGIASMFFLLILGVILVVSAVALSVVTFVLSSKNKDGKPDVPNYIPLIEDKNKELNGLNEIREKYKESIEKFFSPYGFTGGYGERLSELKATLTKRSECLNKLTLLESEMEKLSKDEDLKLEVKSVENLSSLKSKLDFVQSQLKTKNDNYAKLQSRIASCETEANSLVDLESEKAELSAKIDRLNKESEILGLTLEFLNCANENLKLKYKQPLEVSLNKYLSLITGKDNAKIDVDFNVSLNEKGVERASDYYSKGYRNLFEICKRFALTDVLFTVEKPVMILDDPFYNLDDDKLKASLKLVKELGAEYQILYTVCHESRVIDG